MIRAILCTVIYILLNGCGEPSRIMSLREEHLYMKERVLRVSEGLNELGFGFDLSAVKIEIKDGRNMAAMFDQINNDARCELNTQVSFGSPTDPNTTFSDGKSRRLAFYDPNSRSVVLLRGAYNQITDGYLAHELAHVYQDQQWGFHNIWRPYQDSPSRELFNITQFIIEGHAELVREAYEQSEAPDSLTELKRANLAKISENNCLVCDGIDSTANLPYSLGMRFLLDNFRDGGWELVEGFFETLPSSTEQIIHPNKLKEDEPTPLNLPIWHDDGLRTELILNSSLGEAFLLTKLMDMDIAHEIAFQTASGWDGDIAQLYKTEDGQEVLLWRILFDRIVDAKQLETAVRNKVRPGELFRLGRVVDWIIGENQELIKKLRIFLSQNAITIEPDLNDEKSTIKQEILIRKDIVSLPAPYSFKKVVLGPKFSGE